MKYLFLDVDGVLNSICDCPNPSDFKSELSERCILLVKQIIDATKCHVVISSSWRLIPSHDNYIRQQLAGYGIQAHDETPHSLKYETRGQEIKAYLQPKFKSGIVESFVILDDENDMDEYTETNLVQTSYVTGIQQYHVNKAIEILNNTK
jgi:hypothetical protein